MRIGTSGFSYKDWVGPFYPEGTKQQDMFSLYCLEFDTAELDYTYYAFPTSRTLASLATRSPEDFVFSIRTHKSITHEPKASDTEAEKAARDFKNALGPLVESGKMGAVLIQYPWSFRMNSNNAQRMLKVAHAFDGMKTAIEFRNDSWANEEALALLRRNGLALCCVDEPRLNGLFPPIAVATSDIAYVRFHGRNTQDWWQARPGSDRYDYEYSDSELDEWIPGIHRIMSSVSETYIYMNNCHMGKAARSARALKKKLMKDA